MPDSDLTFTTRLDTTVCFPGRAAAARYLLDDALDGFSDLEYRGRPNDCPTRTLEALCGIGSALLALNETLAARPADPEPPRRRFRLLRR